LQSQLWAKFKEEFGTPVVNAGNVWYTKHAIPFSGKYYGYAPRVDPLVVDFVPLVKSLEDNNCVALHFDVPNVVKGTKEESLATDVLKRHCVVSPRDEFAKGNFLVDLSQSEDELNSKLHTKQRYNINYARKKGVLVTEDHSDKAFDKFYELYSATGKRQKYYFRSKKYIGKIRELFGVDDQVRILSAEIDGKILASWFLLAYGDTLYYPYGGSSEDFKNLQASCLIGWEAILYAKRHHFKTFDMWGAAVDLDDVTDQYYGFSNFKAKFGGKHVIYIDSYDLVINAGLYNLFNTANKLRWKILKALR